MKTTLFFLIISIFCVQAFGQNEGYADCPSGKIFYRSFGSGKPVLIINGGPGMNSDGFVALAKKLSEKNLTIIYDQRGTGRSVLNEVDSSTITMKLMIEDLECLREHLKINTWIILGHSFGGMLASYYASVHPQHVDALILSSSGGMDLGLLAGAGKNINSKLTRAESDSLTYWSEKINSGDTSHYAKLQRAKALAPAYVYNKKNIPIIAERLTQGNDKVTGLVWHDLQKIHFDCTDKLKSFKQPVLIIQGKQDIVDKEIALKAQRIFKNSNVIFLDSCVHYGWLDRPDIYLPAVEKFLAAN